jgi:hypothetical protein
MYIPEHATRHLLYSSYYMLRAYKISMGVSDVLTERLNTLACCGYYTPLNTISHIIQNAESI